MRALGVLSAALLLAGCVSTNAAVMNPNLVHSAIDPDSVIVYRTANQVPRAYDEVAILNSQGNSDWTNESKMFKSMRKKAASLGANGIVLENMKDPGTGAKVAHALIGTSADRKGKALAIYVHPAGAGDTATPATQH